LSAVKTFSAPSFFAASSTQAAVISAWIFSLVMSME